MTMDRLTMDENGAIHRDHEPYRIQRENGVVTPQADSDLVHEHGDACCAPECLPPATAALVYDGCPKCGGHYPSYGEPVCTCGSEWGQ